MTEKAVNITELIAAAASDKKARDILILDMQEITLVSDSFLICSANSTTQVKAIADNIEEKLKESGIDYLHREGYREGRWVLMDYGTCVAHVFVEEERVFYNLEHLWADAPTKSYQG
ncbi:MAG: ribosome silencing factor [Pelosinus sp.]|nr:ribosome silencing factor [Pelosinus sp.]